MVIYVFYFALFMFGVSAMTLLIEKNEHLSRIAEHILKKVSLNDIDEDEEEDE